MVDIGTPTTARKTEDFTPTQRTLVKNSLGIVDFPYQPEKTYIVFDATSGNNNLHIITGSTNTYSILKGDGDAATDYTDAGGTKVLNYTNAGRYMITIDGDFNGIEVTATPEKYIEVIGGSNYPVSIVNNAFESCDELKNVYFSHVTTIGLESFLDCTGLQFANFIAATSVQSDSFDGCTLLILLELPLITASSLVNLDNLNVAIDLDVDGISNLDSVSLDGNIIPETTDAHDLGSLTKKFNELFVNAITYPGLTWTALPIDLTTSGNISAATVEYRISLDNTAEFRGVITFAAGAIGAKFVATGTTADMFGGKDLLRKYSLFEFGLDTATTTIRSKGWGRIYYTDSGDTLGFNFDFTDLTSVTDDLGFYLKTPLD